MSKRTIEDYLDGPANFLQPSSGNQQAPVRKELKLSPVDSTPKLKQTLLDPDPSPAEPKAIRGKKSKAVEEEPGLVIKHFLSPVPAATETLPSSASQSFPHDESDSDDEMLIKRKPVPVVLPALQNAKSRHVERPVNLLRTRDLGDGKVELNVIPAHQRDIPVPHDLTCSGCSTEFDLKSEYVNHRGGRNGNDECPVEKRATGEVERKKNNPTFKSNKGFDQRVRGLAELAVNEKRNDAKWKATVYPGEVLAIIKTRNDDYREHQKSIHLKVEEMSFLVKGVPRQCLGYSFKDSLGQEQTDPCDLTTELSDENSYLSWSKSKIRVASRCVVHEIAQKVIVRQNIDTKLQEAMKSGKCNARIGCERAVLPGHTKCDEHEKYDREQESVYRQSRSKAA